MSLLPNWHFGKTGPPERDWMRIRGFVRAHDRGCVVGGGMLEV
jgi:hypothetical protein